MGSVEIHPVKLFRAPMSDGGGFQSATPIPAPPSTGCSSCNQRDICLPCGYEGQDDLRRFEEMVYTRRRLRKGQSAYRTGEPFGAFYAVRTGFFKSHMITPDGREQITGFHMPGEIMGMDGIDGDRYPTSAIALEDSEVCIIPYGAFKAVPGDRIDMQWHLQRILSHEIRRDQSTMLLLGTVRAEGRLAAFLLNLSQRFAARGYSPREFRLRMTREEIGSFLGLRLETISRILSKFQEQKLIAIEYRFLRITDAEGLRRASMGLLN